MTQTGKDTLRIDGCSCKPVFSIRGAGGKTYQREDAQGNKLGKDARRALRALAKAQGDEDAGEYRAPENLSFVRWSHRWLEQLSRPSAKTIGEYRQTIAYATEAFGEKPVRRLGPGDIGTMLRLMRERKASPSTQAKHLRVLGACLRSAVQHGYAGSNPLDRLPANERPRPERRESGYFTDDELARLIPELPEGLWRTLVRVALMTGMRQGELSALTWGDVDLQAGTLRVRRTFSGGTLGQTKGRTARTVDLPAEAVKLLGAWWGTAGKPADDMLVFPREDAAGYQPYWRFARGVLYPAMKRAGIDREGPTGEDRDFHSTRHTFARIALEKGLPLSWLSRQLGHSSEAVTDRHYGHWSRAGAQREAEKLEGAFTF